MSTSPTDPDLLRSLLSLLDRKDLVTCMRVSKGFWEAAGPLLYRKVRVERAGRHPLDPFAKPPKHKPDSTLEWAKRYLTPHASLGDPRVWPVRLRGLVALIEEVTVVANISTREDATLARLGIDPRAVPLICSVHIELDSTLDHVAASAIFTQAIRLPLGEITVTYIDPSSHHQHGLSVSLSNRRITFRLCTWMFGIRRILRTALQGVLDMTRYDDIVFILVDAPGRRHDVIVEEFPPFVPGGRFHEFLETLSECSLRPSKPQITLVNFGTFSAGFGLEPGSILDEAGMLQAYIDRCHFQKHLERDKIPGLRWGKAALPAKSISLLTMEEHIEKHDGLKDLTPEQRQSWVDWMDLYRQNSRSKELGSPHE